MEYPEVQATFKQINNLFDIPLKHYDAIAVTGGEPLLNIPKLQEVLFSLAAYNKPVYLYTNGVLLNENTVDKISGMVDGINIGWHGNILTYETLAKVHKKVPLRILIWEKEVTPEFLQFVQDNNIPFRAWVMDECDNPNEDRFILGG